MPTRSCLWVLAVLVALGATVTGQTTWYVDAAQPVAGNGTAATPFRGISPALASAGPGDTILVFPGTYSPSLTLEALPIALGSSATPPTIDHTGLRLLAVEGAASTIIDGEGTGAILLRFFASATGAVVRGFTLRGTQNAYMIRNGSTSPGFEGTSGAVLDGCILEDNGNSYGYAILLAEPGNVVINCTFKGAFLDTALWLSNDFTPTPGGGLIINNTFVGSSNDGVRVQGGDWSIVNNIIANCGNLGLVDFRPVTPGTPILYTVDHNCYFGNSTNIGTGGTLGTGLVVGPTDVLADPQFVDPVNGDTHLSLGSPCVDSGNGTISTDLLPIDGDGDSRITRSPGGVFQPDIGSDELVDVRMGLFSPPSLSGGLLGIETLGPPGDLEWKVFSFALDTTRINGVGVFRLPLDPLQLIFIDPQPLPLVAPGSSQLFIPLTGLPPSVVGATVYAQALVTGSSGARFTNALTIVVRP